MACAEAKYQTQFCMETTSHIQINGCRLFNGRQTQENAHNYNRTEHTHTHTYSRTMPWVDFHSTMYKCDLNKFNCELSTWREQPNSEEGAAAASIN